ncbi:SDR family NAD(P)-dependent oxidoreductase [Saccharopolyspora spinosa]|uniref:NAD(P)-dependent dehydrogenase (Short-subunit alcohol dehydrogenase family) n=2 Tax=Saccharopolyspora spinosa TaxID=60894 RepID=A0A2N3Y0C2_SACSN|nr:SDR family NAD(P)-dependent oxidoreductase [Saccharopolyspora spinosa]PKW16350.1 NAD(P)-dependent dehydrogenase (short-subunit alcohol dehydrogenase family) [Saccharopolyspora spinosa]
MSGKTALVTGASSGIGAGIAQALADAGACVTIVGRDPERLSRIAKQIENSGGRVAQCRVDLREAGASDRAVAGALKTFGRLDVLVHAAGLFEVGEVDDPSISLERQWDVNVKVPFDMTQHALAKMEPGGSVLFLGSIAGVVGFAGASAYCATKGAVENLVRALALDAAKHQVRVNALAPGNVRTPMNEHVLANPAYEARMLEQTPLGRIGEVSDIAPAAVFLVSDAASYITGTSLVVDGGWTAH